MKYRNVMFLCVSLICVLLSGCSDKAEIEHSRLITACYAACGENSNIYQFYVSVPEGESESENGSGTSGGKIYEFTSDNFSEALNMFRKSVSGKIDTSHVSLFVMHPGYLEKNYQTDTEYIQKEIKVTPGMYYCVSMNPDSVFGFISSQCDGNPAKFTKDMFAIRNNYLSCTATELHFAVKNKYYTAAVPVVEIPESKYTPVPSHTAVYAYSKRDGTLMIAGRDYELYKMCRKKLYDSEKLYTVKIMKNSIEVKLDKSCAERHEIVQFANRYSDAGFDILNCVYFSKKKFLSYKSYTDYVDDLHSGNLNFE